MRAATMTEPGRPLEITTLPDPTPEAGEVVLAVEACGICGSDLHLSDAPYAMPGQVLGHELCGRIVAIGPGVEGWTEGERVAALSLTTCGRCGPCLTGRPRLCVSVHMVGADRPGGFAEYIVMPAHDLHRLPEGLDERHGALVEPLAIGLHTVARATIVPGESVLVLGAGPIGQAVTAWLRHAGARDVVVSDPVASRRALAERMGATATVDPGAEPPGEAFARVAGGEPPVVIECVGRPGLLGESCALAAPEGRVVVAGLCLEPDTLLPVVPLLKELDVRFAIYYRAADYTHTIAMIDQGRLDPLPLVTDRITLDQIPERFEALKHPTDECKVLITP